MGPSPQKMEGWRARIVPAELPVCAAQREIPAWTSAAPLPLLKLDLNSELSAVH